MPDYFGTASPPQLYSLGATTTKIFVDSAITVKSDYSATTARDRVASCASTSSGGGTEPGSSPEGRITGSRAVAGFLNNPEIRTYDFNASTGTFTPAETYPLGLAPEMGIKFSDDFTRLVIPYENTLSRLFVYSVSKTRSLSALEGYTAPTLQAWNSFFIGPGATNFYGLSSSSIYNIIHSGTSTSSGDAAPYGTLVSPVFTPGFLFAFTTNLGQASLMHYQRDTNGNIRPGVAFDITGTTGRVGLATNRTYTRLFVARPGFVESYKLSGTGLTFVNSVPVSSNYTPVMVVNRAGTRLYYGDQVTTTLLTYLTIDSDGRLALSAKITTVPHAGRLILDPEGKVLFVDDMPNQLTRIRLDETLPIEIGTQTNGITLIGTDAVSEVQPKSLDFAPIFASE